MTIRPCKAVVSSLVTAYFQGRTCIAATLAGPGLTTASAWQPGRGWRPQSRSSIVIIITIMITVTRIVEGEEEVDVTEVTGDFFTSDSGVKIDGADQVPGELMP